MIERRARRRDDLMAIIKYAPSPDKTDSLLKGVIKDYSYSGICLIANQPLKTGQEIIVNSAVVRPSTRAVVRWQQDTGNDAYKVGLEFVR
jgi:c-di-GMP-binding flagellar brake protein YcgR